MFAYRLAHWCDRHHIHYGWCVAFVTFFTILIASAIMGSAGVLMTPLEKEFGWTTAEISSAFSARLLLFGLCGPFASALMNHFGVRKVVIYALLLVAFALCASCFMTTLWQMTLLLGIFVGAGAGATAIVLGAIIATRWFYARRGLVMGIMTMASGCGQLIFMQLLTKVSETYGWRNATLLLVIALGTVILLVFFFMSGDPQELDIAPYGGEKVEKAAPKAPVALITLLLTPITALRDVLNAPTFWALFFTFFVCGFSTNGMIQTHWISFCGDLGIAATAASGTLLVIGIFNLTGTLGTGWLSDRFDSRALLGWFYGLRGLSLVLLLYSDFSPWVMMLFAMFYGFDWVATVPPTVKLTANAFGVEKAGLYFGWIYFGHQLGAATAASLGGIIRSNYGDYTPALILSAGLCIAAMAMALTIGRGKKTPAADLS